MYGLMISFGVLMISSCSNSNGSNDQSRVESTHVTSTPYLQTTEWNNYWYAGKAELTSYALEQNRYGAIHKGTVVNIFVTEDLSASKQVKLDDPRAAGTDKLPVLKLNQSIKFNTGIYPYSLMLSSFQPVDVNNYAHAVKVTGSVQEWCGMAWFQMNLRNGKYAVESLSYFESEGDRKMEFDVVVQEDAVWNMIRIAPEKLPVGTFSMFPGALYLRLSHKPVEPVQTTASLMESNGVKTYSMEMPALRRKISIQFESAFPWRILAWEDSYPGFDGKVLTTKAVRMKEVMTDYWVHHGPEDRVLRDQLGLPRDTQ